MTHIRSLTFALCAAASLATTLPAHAIVMGDDGCGCDPTVCDLR